MEVPGPTFLGGGGPTFPRGWGSNCIFLYRPIVVVIVQEIGSGPPAPSSGAAHGIVNWVRPHIVLATRNNTTLTPLMQVLLALGTKRQGPTVWFSDWKYDWGIKGCHDYSNQ